MPNTEEVTWLFLNFLTWILCSTPKNGIAYFADAMMRTPKATMTDPPINLTVFTASSDAFDKTVCSKTPTIENTNVNPRTKNAEFRNITSLAFTRATIKLLGHAAPATGLRWL